MKKIDLLNEATRHFNEMFDDDFSGGDYYDNIYNLFLVWSNMADGVSKYGRQIDDFCEQRGFNVLTANADTDENFWEDLSDEDKEELGGLLVAWHKSEIGDLSKFASDDLTEAEEVETETENEEMEDSDLPDEAKELCDDQNYEYSDCEVNSDVGDQIDVTIGREEWTIYKSQNAAVKAAKEYLVDLIASEGVDIFKNTEQHIYVSDTDARIIAQEEVDARHDGEEDRDEDAEMEEADEIEEQIKNDPIGYFVDEQGMYTKEELLKQPWIQYDEDDIVQEVIDIDGLGHILGHYDGEEIELPSGALAYRTN